MIVGVTEEGRPVVDGLFRFYDTHGLPLADILRACQEEGYVASVPHLVQDAARAGWSKARVRAWLDEGYADAYGPAFRDAVLTKFTRMVG